MRTTKSQTKWWASRKIDWKEHYFKTYNHPHRLVLVSVLNTINWLSLLEMGCGGGANLVTILKYLKNKQVGGIDVNPEAIAMCEKEFKGGFFKVSNVIDVMMTDKSVDVILSDMTYIYVGPFKIKKSIKELRRLARKEVVLCEFYEKNPLKRLWLYLTEGYFFYNWPKLLKNLGFYDIVVMKMPKEAWPEGLQEKYCYIIKAKAPKRYKV